MSEERIYPCLTCDTMRTKAEGGATFSICDNCWDKKYRQPQPITESLVPELETENASLKAEVERLGELERLCKVAIEARKEHSMVSYHFTEQWKEIQKFLEKQNEPTND